MLDGQFSENTYRWNHPKKGIIYVRCGGTAYIREANRQVLRGYHCDVTEIVRKEKKKEQELEQSRKELSEEDEIERLYQERDLKNYTIKVHAVKSSGKLVGAVAFGEEAQLLENAGKADDVSYIDAHHEAFVQELRSFKAPLSEVFEKKVEKDKPEADPELMADVYEEIRLAAEDMDIESLEEVFSEMDDFSIPQNEEGRAGEVSEREAVVKDNHF